MKKNTPPTTNPTRIIPLIPTALRVPTMIPVSCGEPANERFAPRRPNVRRRPTRIPRLWHDLLRKPSPRCLRIESANSSD